MQKILKAIAVFSTFLCISILSDEIILQQGTYYEGCSDAYIYTYPSSDGQDNDKLCVLYEC